MNSAANTSRTEALLDRRAELYNHLYKIRWNPRANHEAARLALKAFDAAHPEIKALMRAQVSA